MGDPNQWAVDVIDSLQTDVVELTATRDALAQALANMAECAHDANAAEPMCACPCHAPGGAVAERDRLRAVVGALNEEHAALWRVVNALRLHEQTVAANQDGAEQAIADRWQAVEQALDQLDGSEATDG